MVRMRILLPLLGALVLSAPAFSQSVPTGFTDEVVTSGLPNPVGLGFCPGGDDRIFVCTKNTGQIWVCDTNGNKAVVGTVPSVRTGSERGLLGICVDPNWPASPYVYICYSHTNPSMRVGRYTVGGDVNDPTSLNLSLGAFYQILSNLPDNAFNHNGGTVRFGPDGLLYASFGDDANACTAQTTSDGRGVILRMDVANLPAGAGGPASISQLIPLASNGHVPNPGFSPNSFGPITYAYGLRNPFRFNCDAPTGRLYVADVGQNAWEEYTEIIAPNETGSRNMGWPMFEGFNSFQPSCPSIGTPVAPLAAVSHGQGWASVISFGGRYRNVPGAPFNFGNAYEGDVFYHDYYAGQIRRLKFNGSTWSAAPVVPGQPSPTNWGTGYGQVSDAVLGPDGAIYYVRNNSNGQLRRVKSDATLPQIAVVSGDGQAANAGQPAWDALVVQATTPAGVPLANVQVSWSIAAGGGVLAQATTFTDANGFSSNSFTFDASNSTNPRVLASLGGGSTPAEFNLTWRGCTVNYFPSGVLLVTARGYPANQPWLFAADAPVANPYASFVAGDVWTSILSPASTAFVFDGTGVFGTFDPSLVIAASGIDTWFLTGISLPQPLNLSFQTYGFDPAFTGDRSIIISNRVDVTIQ